MLDIAVNIVLYLQKVVSSSVVILKCCPTSEVSSPESISTGSIWEKVICLGRPGLACLVQLVCIAGRCGIQQVHFTAV